MTTALEGGEGSALRPGRSLPPGKTWYPLYRMLGGRQGRSGEVRKMLPPPGFVFRDRPARTQSLYRLSYPAHVLCIRRSYFRAHEKNKLLAPSPRYLRFTDVRNVVTSKTSFLVSGR